MNTPDFQLPLIGIVGRPNTGKSSLFNLIVGHRMSIVHSEAGVTRDRLVAPVTHNDRQCLLIDTGGLASTSEHGPERELYETIREQINTVLEEASTIIWVVDAQEGITPFDSEMADVLYTCKERVIIAANKCDNVGVINDAYSEFATFGFPEMIPISCAHNRGIEELLDAAFQHLPADVGSEEHPEAALAVPGRFKFAVTGRPNVGKSAIVNALFGDSRVMVSNVPGTTRDAVDVPLDIDCGDETVPVTLVDTGGFRARRKIDTPVEHFSVRRAERSIQRCDVALLVLDALTPATAQDRRIAHIIQNHVKPCIVVGNKWDLIEDQMEEDTFCELMRSMLPFIAQSPFLPVSALTGYNLEGILEALLDIREELNTPIPTGVVNRFLSGLVKEAPPGIHKKSGVTPKIYYATMTNNAPPTFKLFVNKKEAFSKNYLRFLENQIRLTFFPAGGLPIELQLVGHHQEPTELRGSRAAVAGAVHSHYTRKSPRSKRRPDAKRSRSR